MLLIFSMSLVVMSISFLVMSVASVLSKKSIVDREKSSPFECGFDPLSSSRIPFSLRFFLITIIFLIFDVEIALILPMGVTMSSSSLNVWFSTVSVFISVLLIGLYHEWNQGMLSWSS